HIKNIYPYLNEKQFRGAIEYVLRRYQFVSYDEVEAAVLNEADFPSNAAHLTFDDGFIECFTVIRPILLEYGISATFFITTDFIDNKVLFSANLKSMVVEKARKIKDSEFVPIRKKVEEFFNQKIESKQDLIKTIKKIGRNDHQGLSFVSGVMGIDGKEFIKENHLYLTKEQIIKMHSEGFTIGSHTCSHQKLGLIDEKMMEEEISASTKIIQEITGQRSVPFAFPNSGYDVSRKKLEEIRSDNPEIGLIFDSKGFNQDAAFIVNRVWGEHPEFIDSDGHKLPKILHKAYRDAFFLQLRDILKG
ncbi:MAG: polysaccharide deacetylase family protein, partial [Candidatus Heimdallarchaeota archaeon]|nr:polysaccharide deacetylase family protein [Candidatus Heimdallarchaeota archaeon]